MPKIATKAQKKPQQSEETVLVEQSQTTEQSVEQTPNAKHYKAKKSFKKPIKKGFKDEIPEDISKEQADLVRLIRNNQTIRLFTSLYILHRFEEDGFIDEAKGGFVEFFWHKFKVTDAKKLSKEYAYNESFLITAVAYAHSRMMRNSQAILEKYTTLENINIEDVDINSIKI